MEGLLDGRGLSDGRESFDGRGLLAILHYGKCFKNMNITKHLVSFNTDMGNKENLMKKYLCKHILLHENSKNIWC